MDISKALEDLEITLLLEAIYQRFGDDFRGHQKEIIRGKLHAFMLAHNIATVSALQNRVLHEPSYIEALVCALDARSTGLFEHADNVLELRKILAPWLRSCPAPKVWITDCSSAEDVYAVAILLMEEGVYYKTQIYATGANSTLLNDARQATFSLDNIVQYEENYHRAGGKRSLKNYYDEVQGEAVFRAELSRNITWAQYNLCTDSSFNEFELIVCCGNLNDYATRLRHRALQLFYDSLPAFGILSIADAQYSDLIPFASLYKALSTKYGLYQKNL